MKYILLHIFTINVHVPLECLGKELHIPHKLLEIQQNLSVDQAKARLWVGRYDITSMLNLPRSFKYVNKLSL